MYNFSNFLEKKSRSELNKYTKFINSSWGISEQKMREINFSSMCHIFVISHGLPGHSLLKWDHFGILAKGRSDNHCKIKETLLIQELKPTLNDTVGSEKLYLC